MSVSKTPSFNLQDKKETLHSILQMSDSAYLVVLKLTKCKISIRVYKLFRSEKKDRNKSTVPHMHFLFMVIAD